MGFRFQKRIRIFKGLTLNLSKCGTSWMVGGHGAPFNIKDGKATGTVGSPGAGQSYRERLVNPGSGGIGKGSGRSIPGFSLVEAIDICRDHLLGGGGHAMAAGISVHEDKIDSFRTAFQVAAREALSKEAMTAVLELDAEVKLRDLSLSFFESYKLLEPFGQKNPEPLFLCRNVKPKLPGRTMKEKHLRIILTQEGASMEARWFNAPIGNLPPAPWDVAMRIQRGWFRGTEQWQLTLEAVRTAEIV